MKSQNKTIYSFICKKCGKEYDLELTEYQYKNGKFRKYCSRSCANSRVISNDTKNKNCLIYLLII